jgi:CDP-diacylglycerol--glycerol-3-phosphate 3-phosphatidyltransferase
MLASKRLFIIPLSLTLMRAFLAPVVVLLAIFKPLPWAFGVCLTLAFFSDIFDGVIARRLNVASPGIRRLDSIVDTIFYVAVVYAVWHLHPEVLWKHTLSLCLLVSLEGARYVIDFAKFKREASYHMWSSKLWGLLLFLAFFGVLVVGPTHRLVSLAIYIGIVTDLEGIMISFVLPEWENDVPTIFHAIRIRQAAQAAGGSHG